MGGSVIRHVHHHLMGVAMAVCASVVSAPVAFAVRGIPAEVDDTVWRVVLLFFVGGVLFAMLTASRLKWIGEVRIFEEAVALDDPETLHPTEYSLGHNLVNKGFPLCAAGADTGRGPGPEPVAVPDSPVAVPGLAGPGRSRRTLGEAERGAVMAGARPGPSVGAFLLPAQAAADSTHDRRTARVTKGKGHEQGPFSGPCGTGPAVRSQHLRKNAGLFGRELPPVGPARGEGHPHPVGRHLAPGGGHPVLVHGLRCG